MARTPKVTLTASALTLLCLGASLAASPQVLAETLGRDEVHAFAPLDPSTYPGDTVSEAPRALDASTTARQHSTVSPGQQGSPDLPAVTDRGPGAQSNDGRFGTADAESRPSVFPSPADENNPPERERHTSRLPHLATPSPSPEPTADSTDSTDITADDSAPKADVTDPESLTVIVNKQRPLPEDYEPEDLVELPTEFGAGQLQLRAAAAEAAERLFAAAQDEGITLTAVSAYRSFDYQQELYDRYVAEHGTDATDEMSAKPGHSEHQTGLALDVGTSDGQHTLSQSFGQTAAGQWLADNAHEFGFIIRYPEEAHEITGFRYEPWHLRYFGPEYAQQIMDDSGIAETTFDLKPAPDYDL